ncbi:MAG TPA: glycosyltransferase family 2 protein [Gemmatimonadaceae bacterium]
MLRLILAPPLIVVTAVLWLPLLSELLSFLTGRAAAGPVTQPKCRLPRLLFLVPAHNEELMIGSCLNALSAMQYPVEHRRIIVIADNCSDATVSIAKECGVETMERIDARLPGKPRAIAWALDQIDLRQWDACIIIDADSIVAPDFGLGVADLRPLNDIVFQPNNVVLNEFDSWLTRLAGLLGRCRFEVTYPLKQSAGLNCPISNGMGIGTGVLMDGGWRSFSITEDTELYAIYTESGVKIRHAPLATVYSQEADSLRQGATQRRRWLAGRLYIIREWGPRLLRSPRIGWRQKLDAFVELGLSGPVLHLLVALAIVAISLLMVGGPLGQWIAILASISLSALGVTTIVALARHPEPYRTVSSFMMLPLYAAWRVLVLFGTMLTLRDKGWHRTARTAATPSVASLTPPRA